MLNCEGGSLQPAQVVGWSPLPLECPAHGSGRWAIPVAADAAFCCLPLSSSALLAQQGLRTPLLQGRSVLFLPCRCLCPMCALRQLSSSVLSGEREKQKHFLLLSALLSPCQAPEFLWAPLGVTLSASLRRSLACLPLWLAGVFGKGRVGRKAMRGRGVFTLVAKEWTVKPPASCVRGKGGLNCTGFCGK